MMTAPFLFLGKSPGNEVGDNDDNDSVSEEGEAEAEGWELFHHDNCIITREKNVKLKIC